MSMQDQTVRIAMWSGPRNISTAMMRSWENRADTATVDEPLYAHYLKATGLPHPGAEEVIQSQPADWREAVRRLLGPAPGGKRIFYQKHMTHHMLPDIELDWMSDLVNCFLIREPKEMLTSLIRVYPGAELDDTGLPQQQRLFEYVQSKTGETPPVLDAKDVLENPRGMLRRLCEQIGVPFDEAMLQWPPGPRPSDGVWAKHWYGAVVKSTSFGPYRPKNEEVPERFHGLWRECERIYAALAEHRLRVPK